MRFFKTTKDLIKNYLRYRLLRLKLAYLVKKSGADDKTWVFLMPCSIGDVLFLCSLIAAFKVKNGGKVAVLVKQNHELIAKMFRDIDFCISLKSLSFEYADYSKICNSAVIKKGEIFIAHPELNPSLSTVSGILGYKDLTLLDLYKMMLNLGMKAEMAVPNFDIYNLNKAKDFFNENNLNSQKTIILFPTAATCAEVGEIFWKNIISSFTAIGFKVLINAEKNNSAFEQDDVIKINKSLDEVIAISLTCYGAISLRSGICDLLCFGKKKIAVLYPDENSYEIFNLRNIFNQRSDLLEMVLDKNSNQESVEKAVLELFR